MLPNKAEEAKLDVYIWRCRQVYNAALQQRIEAYKRQGKSLSQFDQQKDLTELRQGDPDFGVVPATILRSALKRLNTSYSAFFRRVKEGKEKPGFPRFKGKDRFKSFSFMVPPSTEGSRILIPKIGYVKFKKYRDLKGEPLDASIKRDSTGKWWVSIQCDLGKAPEKVKPVVHTGIDVGLTSFITLSDGGEIDNPRFFRKGETILAERQRKLALKKKGSKARLSQKKLVAKAHAHIHNQRLNFAWKLAKMLFSGFDLISYENLNIKGMVHGNLAKSINDAAWGLLIWCLTCKAEEAGKWAQDVDPRGTSQRCSRCGKVVKKTLSDREHICPYCGLRIGRDHNAALNIDALGLSVVESCLEKAA